MNLTKTLRESGYDLIEGPIRNHKLLQIWKKLFLDEAELYYTNISHAFVSQVNLNIVESQALNIDSSVKDEYNFNIGISMLEEILDSLGMGTFELSSEIKSGKKVSISYENSVTREVPIGELHNYLSDCDFAHPNKNLIRFANRKKLLVVTGVLLAKNLVVEIETDFNLSSDLMVKLNGLSDGKMDFSFNQESTLKMTSTGTNYFPVAVKANKIDFDKGHFDNTKLVTDSSSIF